MGHGKAIINNILGATTLGELSDVDIDSGTINDSQLLFYDSGDTKWKNSAGQAVYGGTILYWNGSNWFPLAPGIAGKVLTTQGNGSIPTWTTKTDASAAVGGSNGMVQFNNNDTGFEGTGSLFWDTGSSQLIVSGAGTSLVLRSTDTMSPAGGLDVFDYNNDRKLQLGYNNRDNEGYIYFENDTNPGFPLKIYTSGTERMTIKGTGPIYMASGLHVSGTLTAGKSALMSTDTIWGAKGDLAVGSGADAASRLYSADRDDGDILVIDTSESLGMKWQANTAGAVVSDNYIPVTSGGAITAYVNSPLAVKIPSVGTPFASGTMYASAVASGAAYDSNYAGGLTLVGHSDWTTVPLAVYTSGGTGLARFGALTNHKFDIDFYGNKSVVSRIRVQNGRTYIGASGSNRLLLSGALEFPGSITTAAPANQAIWASGSNLYWNTVRLDTGAVGDTTSGATYAMAHYIGAKGVGSTSVSGSQVWSVSGQYITGDTLRLTGKIEEVTDSTTYFNFGSINAITAVGGGATSAEFHAGAVGLIAQSVPPTHTNLGGQGGMLWVSGTYSAPGVMSYGLPYWIDTLGNVYNLTATGSSGGGGTITGGGTDNYVTHWTAASNITGTKGFQYDDTTVTISGSTDKHLYVISGASKTVFMVSGNQVGIGTIPDDATPLHVSGNGTNIMWNNETNQPALHLLNSSSNGEVLRLTSRADSRTMYLQTDHIYTNGGSLHLGNSQDIYLRGGDIGVRTTNPAKNFDVRGTSLLSGATNIGGNLDVSGTYYSNGHAMMYYGGSGAPHMNLYSGPTSWRVMAEDGSVTLMTLLDGGGHTGYLGLGTSAPSYKLDVRGDVLVSGALYLGIDGGTSPATKIVTDTSSNGIVVSDNSGNLTQITAKGLILSENPTYDITNGGQIWMLNHASGTNTQTGYLAFQAIDNASNNQLYSEISGAISNDATTAESGFMDFNIYHTGSNETVMRMVSGSVGIGTTTPTQTLDVSGNIRAHDMIVGVSGSDNYGRLSISGNALGGYIEKFGPNTDFAMGIYAGGGQRGILLDATNNFLSAGTRWYVQSPFRISGTNQLELTDDEHLIYTSSGDLVIKTQTTAGQGIITDSIGDTTFKSDGTSLMTLLSGGNVGIGTIAPTEKLDVRGDVFLSGTLGVANNVDVGNRVRKKGNTGYMLDFSNTSTGLTMAGYPNFRQAYSGNAAGNGDSLGSIAYPWNELHVDAIVMNAGPGSYTAQYKSYIELSGARTTNPGVNRMWNSGSTLMWGGLEVYTNAPGTSEITGGGAANYVSYFDGSNSITGTKGLQYDGTTVSISGTTAKHFQIISGASNTIVEVSGNRVGFGPTGTNTGAMVHIDNSLAGSGYALRTYAGGIDIAGAQPLSWGSGDQRIYSTMAGGTRAMELAIYDYSDEWYGITVQGGTGSAADHRIGINTRTPVSGTNNAILDVSGSQRLYGSLNLVNGALTTDTDSTNSLWASGTSLFWGSKEVGTTTPGTGDIIGSVSDTYIPIGDGTNSVTDFVVGHKGSHGNSFWIGSIPSGYTSAEYSIGMGYLALDAVTSGDYTTAIGYNALTAATTPGHNTAVGNAALQAVTLGAQNTAVGSRAGESLEASYGDNVFIGYAASRGLTSGSANIAIGRQTLGAGDYSTGIDASNNNIAIGSYALMEASGSDANVAIGYSALRGDSTATIGSTGYNNVAVGYYAGVDNTTGYHNVYVGNLAGSDQTTGTYNVFIGSEAGRLVTGVVNSVLIGRQAGGTGVGLGDNNVAIGSEAMKAFTTAAGNIVIGYQAGDAITTAKETVIIGLQAGRGQERNNTGGGESGVYIGYNAGGASVSGQRNTFVGATAGGNGSAGLNEETFIGYGAGANASGNSLCFVGASAGNKTREGNELTAVGAGALRYVSGSYNTALGFGAMGDGGDGVAGTGRSNTAVGARSLQAVNTGGYNTAVGHSALQQVTTQSTNVAVGYQSGYAIKSAGNVAIGTSALEKPKNTASGYNTVVGNYAMRGDTGDIMTGGYNVVMGYGAFGDTAITSASNNVVLGYRAGYESLTTDENVFIGHQSAYYQETGDKNVAIGKEAFIGKVGTDNYHNVAIGYRALYTASGTNSNVAIGHQAAYLLETGTDNVYIGQDAGYSASSSIYNVAVGDEALYYNTDGYGEVAIGHQAGNASIGNYNTFLGFGAGKALAAAGDTHNIAIGYRSMYTATTQTGSIAIGYYAGRYPEGSYNTFIGHNSGKGSSANRTANLNVALGGEALNDITGGHKNVAIGYQSLDTNTTGHSNTSLGYQSLKATTEGAENVAIGAYAGYSWAGIGASTIGAFGVFVGHTAGFQVTGNASYLGITLVGHAAGYAATGAIKVTGIGQSALYYADGASETTAVGRNAGAYAAGTGNVLMGERAGYVALGDYNTGIGNLSLSGSTGSGNTSIGYEAGRYNTTGEGNLFLGYKAGPSAANTDSKKLFIASGSGTPLIGGDFSAKTVTIDGTLFATAKSFDIKHPTKRGKRLIHGSLEGPEHGVYVRGTMKGHDMTHVELPDYWSKLVGDDYTVQLTSYNSSNVYIVEKYDNGFAVNSNSLHYKFDYFVIGQRERIEVEIDANANK